MPLSPADRKFLKAVDRFKIYLLLMAVGVLLVLLLAPHDDIRAVTSIIGMALCGVFWLTQRLLSFISILDMELSRLVAAAKWALTDEEKKEHFPHWE